MGGKCPCANPPGTGGKLFPQKMPKPRPPSIPKQEGDTDFEKKGSVGVSLKDYLNIKYHNTNNRLLVNNMYMRYRTFARLSGFAKSNRELLRK